MTTESLEPGTNEMKLVIEMTCRVQLIKYHLFPEK